MEIIKKKLESHTNLYNTACSILDNEIQRENNTLRFNLLVDKKNKQELSQQELIELNDRKNIDTIYNFLKLRCDDLKLMRGIVANSPKGASLKDSLKYAHVKAREIFSDNNTCAMVDDATVFMWIREYFISFTPKTKKEVTQPLSSSNKKSNNIDHKINDIEEITLDLF